MPVIICVKTVDLIKNQHYLAKNQEKIAIFATPKKKKSCTQ